jgi:hypothetical protein
MDHEVQYSPSQDLKELVEKVGIYTLLNVNSNSRDLSD